MPGQCPGQKIKKLAKPLETLKKVKCLKKFIFDISVVHLKAIENSLLGSQATPLAYIS